MVDNQFAKSTLLNRLRSSFFDQTGTKKREWDILI